jgi:excisionase family DNA binding protein
MSQIALLKPEQVAEDLKISRASVYKLIKDQKLRAFRIGSRLLRINSEDLEYYKNNK